MFGDSELTRWLERKEALLLQSDVHRRALVKDARLLRPAAGWVDLGVDLARKARAGFNSLAPLLSWWGGRKRASSGVLRKMAGVVSVARSVTALWKGWR